ncbi:MAG TPA: class I SAM-dependent methyltransferase [Burkholderiaceae bacterium]|nr:class I SAM-dependent methyltransferase [Burkholderiaceae bacterium]
MNVKAKLKTVYAKAAYKVVTSLPQRRSMLPSDEMFLDADRVDGSHSTSEFIAVGDTTVQWLIDYEGLKPSHRFLDVGCGIGRMARPLMQYLEKGKYNGFDITKDKVAYCRRTIGRKRPDFVFHHADVFNKYYNPRGKLKAADYRFPLNDATVDYVLLVSVFTHMLPEDMEHYLSEITRVLSPGGKCVISYWLADAKKGPPFHDWSESCEILNPAEPEHGVIYLENFVIGLYAKYGLHIQTLLRGSDRKRVDSNPGSRQDIVIAVKPGH